jgi:hypothetical protein
MKFACQFVLPSLLVFLALLACTNLEMRRPVELPNLVIWSWEHDDNLEFIDPEKVAVAYYAGTIMLGRDVATLIRRRNPFHVEKTVICFPVFRMENVHRSEPASAASFDSATEVICKYLEEHPNRYVQIDFDAKENDRPGYLQFLQTLRHKLAGNTVLSITALGSWCLEDKWLQAAPVDEVVAMMFSMGEGRTEAMSALARRKLDSGAAATQSLGLSINEPETNQELRRLNSVRNARRVYVFSSLGWTKRRYEKLMAEVL